MPRRWLAPALVVACGLYPFIAFAVLTLIGHVTPTIYDGTLARLDGAAGLAAIRACYQLLAGYPTLRLLAIWTYDGSVLLAMLAIAARWRLSPGGDVVLPSALLVAAVAGPVCYLIVPATGPVFVWPHFPEPATTLSATSAFRNAMPSLHLTVTLLVAAALWPLGWVARMASLAFVALTIVATLGFGQHYVIDLVVALPFAGAVWFGVRRRPQLAVPCAAVTAVSLVAIRLLA